ncbi:DNA topoisomerase VI subunit B [Nanoarchaeota archaeon]|nr:MAG: DNA topoisomerase VI subunit B [Nanoarchaeota archaeon]
MVEIAEEVAKKYKEVSIAEFFEKNRHLLGFDSRVKSILTCVKEAVENSIDAIEELNYMRIKKGKDIIGGEVLVEIKREESIYDLYEDNTVVGELVHRGRSFSAIFKENKFEMKKRKKGEILLQSLDRKKKMHIVIKDRPKVVVDGKEIRIRLRTTKYKIVVEDNGHGIVKQHIPKIFGKFLYGSRFHAYRQSRGQQGIGIHSVVLYAQLTTGKPTKVTSRISERSPAYFMEIMIDVAKNEPKIINEGIDENFKRPHGTRVEFEVEGTYIKSGKFSVLNYLKYTNLANPHIQIIFKDPYGEKFVFKRKTKEFPPEPKTIKPHPHGVELGILLRMLKNTRARTLIGFLTTEFCKVGKGSAKQILRLAKLKDKNPRELDRKEAESLLKAMQRVKLQRPPTDCLSPIGAENIEKSLKAETNAEYVCAVTREPNVYRGIPFLVEVGLAYDEKFGDFTLIRFANKIPLLFDMSACAITKAVQRVRWKSYGINEASNGMPEKNLILLVHVASVWIPYTSEGKTAIAGYPVIIREIKLGLQECARKLSRYLSGKRRIYERKLRLSIFERYLPEVAKATAQLVGKDEKEIYKKFEAFLKSGENEKGSVKKA